MQDQYASPQSPVVRSASLARKTSVPNLPINTPTGPRTEQHRALQNDVARPMSDRESVSLQAMSSRNTGSPVSTPMRVAPPVPSMVPPIGSTSKAQDQAVDQHVPPAVASLRNIKMRKQAIAAAAMHTGAATEDPSAVSLNQLGIQAQLKAQQLEISQLKKERENMINEMTQLRSDQSMFKEMLARLETVEKWQVTQSSAIAEDQIKSLIQQEVTTKTENTKQLFQTKLNATETQLMQRIDDDRKSIASLLSEVKISTEFKVATEKHNFPAQFRTLNNKIQEIEHSNSKTYARIESLDQTLNGARKQSREDIAQLSKDVDTCIVAIKKEHNDTGSSITERLRKMETLLGQVKTFQGEQARLSTGQKKLDASHNLLSTRVGVLERDASRAKGNPLITAPQTSTKDTSRDTTIQKLNKHDNDINKLLQESAKLESLASRFNQLDKLVGSRTVDTLKYEEQLDKRIEGLSNNVNTLRQSSVSQVKLSEELSNLEARFSSSSDVSSGHLLEPIQTEIVKINSEISGLYESLDSTRRDVHDHSNAIQTLTSEIPSLFRQIFDPFRQDIKQHFGDIDSKLETASTEIADLEQQVISFNQQVVDLRQKTVNAHDQTPQSTFTEVHRAQLHFLEENLFKLKEENASRDRAVQELKEHLANKADVLYMNRRTDAFQHALKSLQDQYNNITTDEQYQRMVHWFTQMYPSNAANMVQQFAAIQQDLVHLQSLAPQATWIQSHFQDLSVLVTNAPKLHALLLSMNDVQRLPQTVEKIRSDARAAIERANEACSRLDETAKDHARMQGTLSSFEASLRKFDASLVTFAGTQAVNGLDRRVTNLKALVDECLAEQNKVLAQVDKQSKTVTEVERVQWVKVDQRLQNSADEIKKLTARLDRSIADTPDLQTIVSKLRRDFDEVNDKLIQPNKAFLEWCGIIPIILTQLQKVVEDVNQNLPVALTFEWDHDLNAPPLEEPEVITK